MLREDFPSLSFQNWSICNLKSNLGFRRVGKSLANENPKLPLRFIFKQLMKLFTKSLCYMNVIVKYFHIWYKLR